MDSLLAQLDDLHVLKLPWLLQKADGRGSLEDIESYMNTPDKAAFVAGDTAVVGHPGHRRQGFGAALVRAVVDWSRNLGASRIELGFYEFNEAAHAFWQSLGFDPLSRRVYRSITPAD